MFGVIKGPLMGFVHAGDSISMGKCKGKAFFGLS